MFLLPHTHLSPLTGFYQNNERYTSYNLFTWYFWSLQMFSSMFYGGQFLLYQGSSKNMLFIRLIRTFGRNRCSRQCKTVDWSCMKHRVRVCSWLIWYILLSTIAVVVKALRSIVLVSSVVLTCPLQLFLSRLCSGLSLSYQGLNQSMFWFNWYLLIHYRCFCQGFTVDWSCQF